MDRAEAAHVLGVAVDADQATVRDAFRTLIRAHHPDRAGASSVRKSTLLIEAHRVLRESASRVPAPSPPSARAPAPSPPVDARVDGDSLVFRAEPEAVMALLVEAGHRIGEVTYLDRAAGLLEVLVGLQEDGGPHPVTCSLVASLQGRVDAIEVFCTVERLDGHGAPPIAVLVEALAAAVTGRDVPLFSPP